MDYDEHGFKIEHDRLLDYREQNGITKAVIPHGVTEISAWVFRRCSLAEIIIPDTVTRIDSRAFEECFSLKRITIDKNNPNFADLDGILYDKALTRLVCCPCTAERLMLPEHVTSISPNAFANCKRLKEIAVSPGNEKFIVLDDVLYDKDIKKLYCCPRNKMSVKIPSSIRHISGHAFQSCEALTSIDIPEGITEIGRKCFEGCIWLASVHLPASLLYIEECAFRRCINLRNIALPDRLTHIIDGAFDFCRNLEYLEIPDSVEWAGCLFTDCSHLQYVLCRGMKFVTSEIPADINDVITMVVWKDFDVLQDSEFKYDLIFKMLARNPQDEEIQKYLTENCIEILSGAVNAHQEERIKAIFQALDMFITKETVTKLIQLANELQNYEIQVMLTEYKAKKFGFASDEDIKNKFSL